MIINGFPNDKPPIVIRGNHICFCDKYVYVGAVFTTDGSLKSSIGKYTEDEANYLHKLIIFLNYNRGIILCVIANVVEAAFNYVILYGRERDVW